MKKFFYLFLFIILISCASEKMNMSPLTTDVSVNEKAVKNFGNYSKYVSENTNAAEITNLIASFPKFQDNEVNKEIVKLKTGLQDYLYAVEAGNMAGKERSLKKFEISYKQIQKLRKKLNEDEDEVMNRYLVRLKTNVNVIENYLKTSVNN